MFDPDPYFSPGLDSFFRGWIRFSGSDPFFRGRIRIRAISDRIRNPGKGEIIIEFSVEWFHPFPTYRVSK